MSECHFTIFATLSTYKLLIFAKALKAFCVSFACLHYRGQNFHLCLCQGFVSRPSLRSAGPWCIQSSLYQCIFISIKESFIYQIGKLGSEESLTFTLCWIVLTWHLTCWLMRNIMACRKSKVKDEWASCWSSRHISGPKLFINILFGPAPIHPYLWYMSRIGSVISSIYLHLSRGSLVYVVCVCACACICVFESLSVYKRLSNTQSYTKVIL